MLLWLLPIAPASPLVVDGAWPDGVPEVSADAFEPLVPVDLDASGRITRIACTEPWCLVVVKWRVNLPNGAVDVTTSGGGESGDPQRALLTAISRSVDDLMEQLPAEPESVARSARSPGERWMIRGGYAAGIGIGLIYFGVLADAGDATTVTVTAGLVSTVTGIGMAAGGLAMGRDHPVAVVVPPVDRRAAKVVVQWPVGRRRR
ncbi:MAG: hypothetical protein AAF211_21710 [Myxococcota bacterium]